VKRDILNGSIENVMKLLQPTSTSKKKEASPTPAPATEKRRSKWKINSEELPLQTLNISKSLKEQDTNKSSVSSSSFNKLKIIRSDSPVICLNLERNTNESFVYSEADSSNKMKIPLNSQSMSRTSIGNNSNFDIEIINDKRLRMSDLDSSPKILLHKQKENAHPKIPKNNFERKPSITKNTRVNQSVDHLRVPKNSQKVVAKHITPVKKVSNLAAAGTVTASNQSFQISPKDSDILTITSLASSHQKDKSPQSKISCKFVNSIQVDYNNANNSHTNIKLEYVDTVRSSFGSQHNFHQAKNASSEIKSQFAAKYSIFDSQRQICTEPAVLEEEESPRMLNTYGIHLNYGGEDELEDLSSPQTPKKEKSMFSFQNHSALKRANELDSVRSSKPEFDLQRNEYYPVKKTCSHLCNSHHSDCSAKWRNSTVSIKNLTANNAGGLSDRKKSPGKVVTTSMSSKVEFDVFKRLSDPGYQTFNILHHNNETKNTESDVQHHQEPITEKYEEEKEYRLDTQEFEDFVEQLQVRAQNMTSKYETLVIDESQEVGDIKPISFDLKAHTLTEKPHGASSGSSSKRSSQEIEEEDEPTSTDPQRENMLPASDTEFPEIPKDSYQSVRIKTTEETNQRITEPDSPVFNIQENSKRLSLQSFNSQRSHEDLAMKRKSFAQPVTTPVPTVTSLHETVKDLHCPPQSKGASTKAHSFISQGGNTSNSLREMSSVPVSLTSLLDQQQPLRNNFKANIDKLFQEPKLPAAVPPKQFIHKAPSRQILVNDKKRIPKNSLDVQRAAAI